MLIKGYEYLSEESCQNAIALCNQYYGIPVIPEDVTQTWVDCQIASLNNPKFWYIVYNDSLLPVLGEPTEFEVVYAPSPFG